MSEFLEETDYGIGYIDSGHGNGKKLPEVALKNHDGHYLKSTEASIGNAGPFIKFPDDPTDSFAHVNAYDLEGADTWPITMITYFYLENDLSHLEPTTASMLLFFVFEYVTGGFGQDIAKENGFEPLPADVKKYNDKTYTALKSTLPDAGIEFTIETGKGIPGKTDPRIGMGPYVISPKRRDYGEIEIERLKPVTAQVAEVEKAQAAEVEKKAAPPSLPPDSDDDGEYKSLAIAGTVLGAVGFVLGLLSMATSMKALSQINTGKPRSQEIPVRNIEVPEKSAAEVGSV